MIANAGWDSMPPNPGFDVFWMTAVEFAKYQTGQNAMPDYSQGITQTQIESAYTLGFQERILTGSDSYYLILDNRNNAPGRVRFVCVVPIHVIFDPASLLCILYNCEAKLCMCTNDSIVET